MKKAKFLRATTLILILIFILISPACKKKEAKKEETIKIGAILPLTGPIAYFGEYEKNAIEIAVEEINGKGGVYGKNVVVVYEDHKNDPKEGVSAINRLAKIEKIPVIITQMSGVSMAMAPVADQTKTVLVSLCMHPQFAKLSSFTFRIFESITQESEILAEFVANELKLKNVVILYINDAWGQEARKSFKEKFVSLGGIIILEESFSLGEKNFNSYMAKIKLLNADAVYIASYGPATINALKSFKDQNLKSKILGNIGMSWDYLLREAGLAAEDAIIVMPNFIPEEYETLEFVRKYKEKYATLPNNESAFTYDAFMIIIDAIKKGGYNAENIRRNLSELKSYNGICGTYLFDDFGDTRLTKIAIRVVKNGKLLRIK